MATHSHKMYSTCSKGTVIKINHIAQSYIRVIFAGIFTLGKLASVIHMHVSQTADWWTSNYLKGVSCPSLNDTRSNSTAPWDPGRQVETSNGWIPLWDWRPVRFFFWIQESRDALIDFWRTVTVDVLDSMMTCWTLAQLSDTRVSFNC